MLSRHSPEYRVDLRTGAGLEEALRDVDVVVDASNAASTKGAAATLVEGSRRLLAAGSSAGVRHHVCVSIVGCERVPSGYYRAKVAQERLVEQGPLPWTLARATQFHELLAAALAAAARSRVLPVPRARLQTVSADEVAVAVADAAERPALRARVEVAGPRVEDARALARQWRTGTARRALLLPVPVPGGLGRALRGGALTAEHPDVRGTVTFAAWLASGAR